DQGRSGTGLFNLSESPREVFHDGISAVTSSGLFDGELPLQPLDAGFSAKLAEAERSGLPDEWFRRLQHGFQNRPHLLGPFAELGHQDARPLLIPEFELPDQLFLDAI